MQFPSVMFHHFVFLTRSLPSDGNKLVLEGQHNYDAGWVSELQSNASLVICLSSSAVPYVLIMLAKDLFSPGCA
jgi:hypothetical protein